MATPFCLSMGYNFGCMIASDTLFDSRGWVFGVKIFDEDIADFEVLRDVAMTTIFGSIIRSLSREGAIIRVNDMPGYAQRHCRELCKNG